MLSDDLAGISEETGAGLADREVLISGASLGHSDWGHRNRRLDSTIGDSSRIIDTGFNGGALCSFNWMRKYKQYSKSIKSPPLMPKLEKTVGGRMEFSFRNQGPIYSDSAFVLPIWVEKQFSPVRVRLISVCGGGGSYF